MKTIFHQLETKTVSILAALFSFLKSVRIEKLVFSISFIEIILGIKLPSCYQKKLSPIMLQKDKRKYKAYDRDQEFDQLFLQHYSLLVHFGKKLTTEEYVLEECIQELFIYLYEKEIDLSAIQHKKAYLFTALRRRILDRNKQAANAATLPSFNPTAIQFSSEDFLVQQEENQQRNKFIATALNNLPWRQREAIYLRFFNNLSAKEIAEVMGITTQVVSNTIYKAIKKIRNTMKYNG